MKKSGWVGTTYRSCTRPEFPALCTRTDASHREVVCGPDHKTCSRLSLVVVAVDCICNISITSCPGSTATRGVYIPNGAALDVAGPSGSGFSCPPACDCLLMMQLLLDAAHLHGRSHTAVVEVDGRCAGVQSRSIICARYYSCLLSIPQCDELSVGGTTSVYDQAGLVARRF